MTTAQGDGDSDDSDDEPDDDATFVIFSLTVHSDEPIDALASFALPPRPRHPDAVPTYQLGHIRFEEDDWDARADRLDREVHAALDRLAAVELDPAVLRREDVSVRAFFTFGNGAETISAEVVRRLADVGATIWIDISA